MNRQQNILLAFYGDDFTGSTDALEFITRAGAKTVLFTETPDEEQLNKFPGLNAFGVAGKTRSLSPGDMEKTLAPAFQRLRDTGALHIHYKVCSTFDSSPSTGSIGKAIDCGAEVFNHSMIPVLGGAPALGRYCLFGNLYARMGIGSKGKIYRLDRHPSMSRHPVTPADESDLRLHLGKQTGKKIGLIDVLQFEKDIETWNDGLEEEVVLIDALYEEHLEKIGAWMERQREEAGQLFSVGSSGVEMGLGAYWGTKKILEPVTEWTNRRDATPLLVVSGSCSPVTSAQIAWAKSKGFEEVELDAIAVCNDDGAKEEVTKRAIRILQQQKHVIIHTGSKQSQTLPAEKLGAALGCIAKSAVVNAGVKRVVVSGGDTSSYAARAMEIDAVEMIAPAIIGAPLCKAYSRNKGIEGIEVNFKGGQVGSEDYFGALRDGLQT